MWRRPLTENNMKFIFPEGSGWTQVQGKFLKEAASSPSVLIWENSLYTFGKIPFFLCRRKRQCLPTNRNDYDEKGELSEYHFHAYKKDGEENLYIETDMDIDEIRVFASGHIENIYTVKVPDSE